MNFTRRRALATLSALPLLTAACGRASVADGVLRVGLAGGPDSLDPLRAEYAISALLFRMIFTPLVGYGVDGGTAPGLAKEWSGSPDSKIWTLTLDANRTWSDGNPVSVSDVLGTFRRGADPATAYPDIAEFFMIEGVERAAKGQGNLDSLGIRALDDTRIEFTLTASDAGFPRVLREFYPLPTHALDAHGDRWSQPENFVGSGPYVPTVQTQQRLEFAWNARHGEPPDSAFTTISIEAVDDAATRGRMVRAGDLDLVQDPPLNQLWALREEFGERLQLFDAPRLFYLSFNTRRGPLADPTLRRMLARVIDRKVLAQAVFQNAVAPAHQLMRGEPAYGPQGQEVVDATRAVLAQLGATPEKPLQIQITVARDDRERAALLIADMWKPLGVEATIFATDATGVVTALNAGDFDVGITRLDKGLKSDPLDLLSSFATGGTAQSHGWSNASYDRRLQDARAEANTERRAAIIADAESMLMQDSPIAPLWYAPTVWLAGERIAGIKGTQPPIFWDKLRAAKA